MAVDEEDQAVQALAQMCTGDQDAPRWRPTEAQVVHAERLLLEREWPHTYTRSDLEAMERSDLSAVITGLKQAQRKHRRGDGRPPVDIGAPEGRYAVTVGDDLWFIQVDKPMQGRWKGYVFIDRLIGAPGNWYKQSLSKSQRDVVCAKIDDDPEAASVRYGREHRQCGVCGSPLSNPESRAAGIGPICAGRLGWG